MKGWDELVATALLGTQRRPVDTAALPPKVRGLLPGGDATGELLTAAALMTGYRRAGRVAARDADPVPVAAVDERPLVPSAARQRLAGLLTARDPDLLDEWLLLVERRGLRVPPERLPALVSAARDRVASRSLTASVAGPLSEWLAEVNPEWEFLAAHAKATGEDDVWRYGTTPQRTRWLASALATDPERARAELASAWRSEPAQVRVEFLTALGSALTPEDDLFLETVLDDRAQQVRKLAAELLQGLPASGLATRMADRVRALVSVQHRGPRREVLVVTLPEECDEELRRDGVVATPPKGGPRAWWLRQIVAAAPMSAWAGFAPNPEALLRMRVEGCDEALLRESWAVAAARQREVSWARALLDADPDGPQRAGLVAALPREQWAEAVGRLATRASSAHLSEVVVALPRPWPAELGTALLDWLVVRPDERAVAAAARVIARAVPPVCLNHPLTTGPLPEDVSPWRRQLVETLNFRREMHEELR
ncbi:DUF5691 domain-containing protein [Amycolatopsis sp.]|uniref:DUF5691 domain-containing protein n=1 Tax=Amycolatopsis sp. TaxID=37632 RepID=UPI002E03DC52|nr:DUF5691 domain-containing protein [Amycolatopsis sp.]